jgi:hypothetical protein
MGDTGDKVSNCHGMLLAVVKLYGGIFAFPQNKKWEKIGALFCYRLRRGASDFRSTSGHAPQLFSVVVVVQNFPEIWILNMLFFSGDFLLGRKKGKMWKFCVFVPICSLFVGKLAISSPPPIFFTYYLFHFYILYNLQFFSQSFQIYTYFFIIL